MRLSQPAWGMTPKSGVEHAFRLLIQRLQHMDADEGARSWRCSNCRVYLATSMAYTSARYAPLAQLDRAAPS